jgi:excisionase family DNA binding protein
MAMEDEKLLKPKEAAEILNVSPVTIRYWLRTGKLPGVKVSNMWRVRKSDLKKMIFDVNQSWHGQTK